MKFKPVTIEEVQPGDLALHTSNQLDAREVSRIDGDQVWIFIGESNIGPLPAENYTYSRRTG